METAPTVSTPCIPVEPFLLICAIRDPTGLWWQIRLA
jgi:hypothetical protein